MRLEHIGIAVKNLDHSSVLFSKLLGNMPYKTEKVEREGVLTAFFESGESKIELLQATSADSAIARFIEKKGEGIHHLAFEVEDIALEMKRLKAEGFAPLSEHPFKGADNKLVCFFHPKECNGVLIEICQSIAAANQ